MFSNFDNIRDVNSETTVGGVASLASFSRTILLARKQDQMLYENATRESAVQLGMKREHWYEVSIHSTRS